MQTNKPISFQIEYDNGLVSKIKGTIFKIVKNQGKFYIASFENVLTEIKPINLKSKEKHFLENLKNNFATLLKFNSQNKTLIIECNIIFDARKIEHLDLNLNPDIYFSKDILLDLFGNKKGLLVLTSIYNNEKDSMIISNSSFDEFYEVNKKQEIGVDGSTIDYYCIEKEVFGILRNFNEFQIYLFYGEITVSMDKHQVSPHDMLCIKAIQNDITSYLNIWNTYNEKELLKHFDAFKKFGIVKYKYYKEDEKGVELYFDDANFNKIKKCKDNMFIIGTREMIFLFDNKNIEEYSAAERVLFEDHQIALTEIKDPSRNINDLSKSIRVFFKDKKLIDVLPVNNGNIALSLAGNKIAYQRRLNAKTNIFNGKTGIKNLYTWFTDDPMPSDSKPRVEIDNSYITQDVKLTLNQREAIDIILNTPDIAIIQGPPGTGKTTVIREALIQINANQNNKYSFGNNLLSGFKKETVENLIKDIELFGLPPINIKNETDENNEKLIDKTIYNYVDNLLKKLKEKYKDLSYKEEQYLSIYRDYLNYKLFDNTIESSIAILNKIKESDEFKFDFNITNKIQEFINKIENDNNELTSNQRLLIDLLYSLPLTKEGYEDDKDYIQSIITFYEMFDDIKEDILELKEAILHYSEEKLRVVRKKLLLKYKKPKEIFINSYKKKEIIDFLDTCFAKLKLNYRKEINGEERAILDYISSLYENPKYITETILNYTKVLGSTNQYCVSKEMAKIKNGDNTFDNVYIDEAATSSPLDLFIPLSLAQNKIVMVGDHKQLPNITDEDLIDEVAKDINADVDSMTKEMKETLFEVLMKKALLLERKDGIRRVITLNTQFRMHPELGKIVSDNFYDGEISSIRPASDFDHIYHNLNNYLYWIDVPEVKDHPFDYKNKNSSSRKNVYEAKAIAKHIQEALKQGTNLSIGVITIYRDQVETIKKEFRLLGLDTENIEIGTVDAFQGREFDVVYLSLAYVFNVNNTFSRLGTKESDSLLCVALSRQKKMLIVVGDMNVFGCDLAKVRVPKIYNICEKCRRNNWYE